MNGYIGNKMLSEIESMEHTARYRWYKTITPEEKAEAIRALEIVRQNKIKVAWTPEKRIEHSVILSGLMRSEDTKVKMSASWTPERRAKMRISMTDKKHNKETRAKISTSHIGIVPSEETRAKLSATKIEHWKDLEYREKISTSHMGEKNPSWKGGVSFEPYCPRFNKQLKESIRNRDNRTCVLCGKGEIQNGRRLLVHHIDADKMQGCNGKKWYLCALCTSCNSKPDTIEKEFLIVTGGNKR